MRCVVQRVTAASVVVEGRVVGEIGRGLVALIGVANGDGTADIAFTASKIRGLRVFEDAQGKMNRSVLEAGGAILAISQFTLLGDARRGRRPAFDDAAPPAIARVAYDAVVQALRTAGVPVATGIFQADMALTLTNDGPVTILLDSRRTF
ncbi:MAG TPA: D-aminoacyl-tRNA deacylase [Vicinamibacterales bacterium]